MPTPAENLTKICTIIGATNLAKKIGISRQAISNWCRGHYPIPPYRAQQIVHITQQIGDMFSIKLTQLLTPEQQKKYLTPKQKKHMPFK